VILVDTSAWYALASSRDTNHVLANRYLRSIRERLVTTDYIIDETLTLFRSRGEKLHSLEFGRKVIVGKFAEILTINDQDFQRAWAIFQQYDDKGWSFTDCTSFAVMERKAIPRAFAFDDHFRQFGTVSVLP
jgi:uncharacterized protein